MSRQEHAVSFSPLTLDNIVILEAGCQFVRFGVASDSAPLVERHVIARVCRGTPSAPRRDTVLPRAAALSRLQTLNVQRACAQLTRYVHARLADEKSKEDGDVVSLAQLAARNKHQHPVRCCAVSSDCDTATLDTVQHADGEGHTHDNGQWLVGESGLVAAAAADTNGGATSRSYHVHYPLTRGRLRAGVSRQVHIADLRDIWRHCVARRLGVRQCSSQRLLGCCGVVLLVPCTLPAHDLHLMLQVLFDELGFGRALVLCQAAAASLVLPDRSRSSDQGRSAACVVRMGDQTCRVSCVLEACCVPSGCVRLPYGGADVSLLWLWLLQRAGFPYGRLDASDIDDALLLDGLKCRHGTMEPARCLRPRQCEFSVRRQHHIPLLYSFLSGLDSVLAGLGVFSSALLDITGRPDLHLDSPHHLDHHHGCGGDVDVLSQTIDSVKDSGDDVEGDVDTCMPLDQAIMWSVRRSADAVAAASHRYGSVDCAVLRRQWLSNIVVTGGASRWPHFDEWLRARVSAAAAGDSGDICAAAEVRVAVSDQCASGDGPDDGGGSASWRGARALLAVAPSAELWTSVDAWRRYGVRAVTRKTSLHW